MKIKLNPYDNNSIDNAVRMVTDYRNSLDDKVKTLLVRLAGIGLPIIDSGFASAEYDGDKGVITSGVTYNDNGATIYVTGEKVAFIEFGTGITYQPYSNSEIRAKVPPRGSYGKGFGNRSGWVYEGDVGTNGLLLYDNKVFTRGNPPAERVLTARNEIIAQVITIAREVFNSD